MPRKWLQDQKLNKFDSWSVGVFNERNGCMYVSYMYTSVYMTSDKSGGITELLGYLQRALKSISYS